VRSIIGSESSGVAEGSGGSSVDVSAVVPRGGVVVSCECAGTSGFGASAFGASGFGVSGFGTSTGASGFGASGFGE
jgi:hypothetical protein